jgi:hypothetical protein
MNDIKKIPVSSLGYNFIPAQYLPAGEDEYYLRNKQNRSGISYRQLNAQEIEILVRNRNSSDDWNKILVSDSFNAELVKNCKFFGLVRIGKLEPFYLEFHGIRMPVGIYNSTIISCDFGDNVVIDNVTYLSHYIIGNEAIVVNVNELANTNYSKFGNGVIKEGEDEKIRIWLELCNENGGRSVIPFSSMLPGDAWLWTRHRDDDALLKKFKEFTQQQYDNRRGYYGKVGDRTVIKNCKIIKDVWIGSDAYLKGANKIKNVTINSDAQRTSQIGEGCEIVNGSVGYGCRIFYGVKAVRFVMASHSQLKYGARLINSYLGNNATISCCEVLNSLIFPAHEQHHNNSFLCAALIMGQSNIAAGATIGSNHNSRGADGELIAGRGFWPGLCVSLKHNSRFASFTMMAKGDYPAELDIPLPFSLISMNEADNELVIMPGYWFLYNMYALARNAAKYVDRDQRSLRIQNIEYDYLAPDTVNEMFTALRHLALFTGNAWVLHNSKAAKSDAAYIKEGTLLLRNHNPVADSLDIFATGYENSRRRVALHKVPQAWGAYTEMIRYYGITQLMQFVTRNSIQTFTALKRKLNFKAVRTEWLNVGGQLIPAAEVEQLKTNIKKGNVNGWEDVRTFYKQQGAVYEDQKFEHAFASLIDVDELEARNFTPGRLATYLKQAIATREKMVKNIYESRAKDYSNPFRKMVYENETEMNNVIGSLEDNAFIKQQRADLKEFKQQVARIVRKFSLNV